MAGQRFGVAAAAEVRLNMPEVQAMRRVAFSGPCGSISPNVLKHMDEQTLASLAALRIAITKMKDSDSPDYFEKWAVLSSPRYLGRSSLRPTLARFHAEGAWGVSPHMIPHRSLHAISGTISQFLRSHGPNHGVSGSPGHVAEGFLAAFTTLANLNLPGCWLTLSRIEPELDSEESGSPHPDSTAEAIAVALVPSSPTLASLTWQLDIDFTRPSEDSFETLAKWLFMEPTVAVRSCFLPSLGSLILQDASQTLSHSDMNPVNQQAGVAPR